MSSNMKIARRIASRILEDRVKVLYPDWVMTGCPYVQRVIDNYKTKKDPFEGFDMYEIKDALAFCVYIRMNFMAPENWEPMEESSEVILQDAIPNESDVQMYLTKYIGDLLPNQAQAKDFEEAKAYMIFSPKEKRAKFHKSE